MTKSGRIMRFQGFLQTINPATIKTLSLGVFSYISRPDDLVWFHMPVLLNEREKQDGNKYPLNGTPDRPVEGNRFAFEEDLYRRALPQSMVIILLPVYFRTSRPIPRVRRSRSHNRNTLLTEQPIGSCLPGH